jgi:hypothetical protein
MKARFRESQPTDAIYAEGAQVYTVNRPPAADSPAEPGPRRGRWVRLAPWVRTASYDPERHDELWWVDE